MKYKKLLLGKLSWKRFMISTFTIFLLITGFAHVYAEKLIFPYKQSSYDETIDGLKFLQTNDGIAIATRYWQAKDEVALIIYFHGNYMDIGHLDEVAELMNQHHYSVLAMDYRGYGLSQGQPEEKNTYQDAQLVYDYAQNLGYKPENTLILGQSVGSGIATELVLKNQAKALVLISPFTSTYRVMTKYGILPFDKFNNLAKIKNIKTSLFIVHGTNDQVIPEWHSEELIDKHIGKHKRILINGGGHNDIWNYAKSDFINQLDLFVKKN